MRDAKDTVELYTNAEKNYMRGQIKDQANLNGLKDIDQLLQTWENNDLKNQETKSVILAPFNSTKSNLAEIEAHYSIPKEIKEMIQSKSCLKFSHKCREIDKQYEVNNNAELDNGVYHEFNVEVKDKDLKKENSLQSDFQESLNSHRVK